MRIVRQTRDMDKATLAVFNGRDYRVGDMTSTLLVMTLHGIKCLCLVRDSNLVAALSEEALSTSGIYLFEESFEEKPSVRLQIRSDGSVTLDPNITIPPGAYEVTIHEA